MSAIALVGLWLVGIGGAIGLADLICALIRWRRQRSKVLRQLRELRP